jgi:hypothetical protein
MEPQRQHITFTLGKYCIYAGPHSINKFTADGFINDGSISLLQNIQIDDIKIPQKSLSTQKGTIAANYYPGLTIAK